MEYFSCKDIVESMNTDIKNDINNTNPYPRIFINNYGFKVFERMRRTVINPLADYSFIYRIMIKDKLIYKSIGDSEFREWLSDNYQIEIDKTKQLDLCKTVAKEQMYSIIKSIIKQ